MNSPVLSLVMQQGTTKPELDTPLEISFLLRDARQTRNAQCVYLDSNGLVQQADGW